MNRDEICKHCTFYCPSDPLTDRGECRRNPPTVHYVVMPVGSALHRQGQHMAAGFQGCFPPAMETHWCGHWKSSSVQ